MHETRPKIPCGIDGVSGGPTQREADGPDQKPYRKGAERSQIDRKNSNARRFPARTFHAKDTEDQNEGSYDLTSQVRWNGANRWAVQKAARFASASSVIFQCGKNATQTMAAPVIAPSICAKM